MFHGLNILRYRAICNDLGYLIYTNIYIYINLVSFDFLTFAIHTKLFKINKKLNFLLKLEKYETKTY